MLHIVNDSRYEAWRDVSRRGLVSICSQTEGKSLGSTVMGCCGCMVAREFTMEEGLEVPFSGVNDGFKAFWGSSGGFIGAIAFRMVLL